MNTLEAIVKNFMNGLYQNYGNENINREKAKVYDPKNSMLSVKQACRTGSLVFIDDGSSMSYTFCSDSVLT